MTLGTHVAFASVLYLGGATLFGYRPDWIGWLLAAAASLLPDVDLPPAKIGRLFWWLSVPLERRFGHRTLTHLPRRAERRSGPYSAPLAAQSAVLLGGGGRLLVAPVDRHAQHPGRRSVLARAGAAGDARQPQLADGKSGSKGEMILLSGLLVAAAALYPLSHIGFRDALQALLKSFDIAVEQYARVSGTHWYELELTATDNLTLERINCRCPVVGTWKHGFIVLHQGQPRAVGKSEAQHNLLPVAARLIQGEPLRVVAERVAMQGHTLRWLVSRIDQSRPYYLLGEVEIADGRGPALAGRLDSVETYNPASYRGGILRLHYARAPELGPWLDLVAVRGEVVVQFWLRPGEAAVTLGPGEERRGGTDTGAVAAVFVNILG